jgi:hypothetical protein
MIDGKRSFVFNSYRTYRQSLLGKLRRGGGGQRVKEVEEGQEEEEEEGEEGEEAEEIFISKQQYLVEKEKEAHKELNDEACRGRCDQ